ncbi:hypothetical protein Sjap_002035 [Stephania japonica]|uniref:Uncharacterized protein n=1 Tax=Stephania japonica TaxID=461633 RepID=A0AAP0PTT6_9MAGN
MMCFNDRENIIICLLHRDIKGSNLLIDNEGNLKLADFGKDEDCKFLKRLFDPLPCDPKSLPKYESSHEFQTKKKRQQQRQQHEEAAKRPSQGMHNNPPPVVAGPGHHYGKPRGPSGGPNRYPQVQTIEQVSPRGVKAHQNIHVSSYICGMNTLILRWIRDSILRSALPLCSESSFSLAWTPNGCVNLSYEIRQGGICIWSASYPGNAASVRSGVASFVGSLSRGSGVRWTLVDFLRSPNDELFSSLSWSPDGRYPFPSSFTIWDVAQGVGTPIRRGLGGISLLKWSPVGDYFFTAKFDGTFYLWETNTWTSERWTSSGGFVTGATWDPDGRMILIAFSDSLTLGSIHFASRAPSLDAHLLPIELPEIVSLTGSHGVEKIAWDASGERLALSYKGGDEAYSGLISIYDVRRTPLVLASLVGFIRGPGENPKPLSFSFHNKFKQGPLLSVCWSSGWCCTYPLIFRSHLLP